MDAQTVVAAVTKAYVEYRDRQIEDAHRKPRAKLNEAINEVQTDLNRLEEQFETAVRELDDQQPEVRETLRRLKESIDRKRKLHEEVIQKMKDLRLVQLYEGIEIVVIAPASPGKRVERFLGKLFASASDE